jgi:hypothetical protein
LGAAAVEAAAMLSNVTKSADVLRGATEMQDLWAEVEKETPVQGLLGPRVLQNHIMYGKVLDEKEKRDELERLAHVRQQKINFYTSESAAKLKARKSDMPASERKAIRDRLTKRPAHDKPRPKSATNMGHVMATGDATPASPGSASPTTPKSRAMISSPGTEVKSSRMRSRPKFEGLTMRDFYVQDWRPSFTYRPAKQESPWENVEGFAQSTRTLERRKMNPYLDINSFQGNIHSAKQQFNAHGWVRQLDNKGNLGAAPVQQWKETLREDFASDADNFSSNAHDANLDAMRTLLANTSILTDLE